MLVRMTRIIGVKQILKLRAAGLLRLVIIRSLYYSKTSVVDVFNAVDSLEISYQDIEPQINAEAYIRFFSRRKRRLCLSRARLGVYP